MTPDIEQRMYRDRLLQEFSRLANFRVNGGIPGPDGKLLESEPEGLPLRIARADAMAIGELLRQIGCKILTAELERNPAWMHAELEETRAKIAREDAMFQHSIMAKFRDKPKKSRRTRAS